MTKERNADETLTLLDLPGTDVLGHADPHKCSKTLNLQLVENILAATLKERAEFTLLPKPITLPARVNELAKAHSIWLLIQSFQRSKPAADKSLGVILNKMVTNRRSVMLFSARSIGRMLKEAKVGLRSCNEKTYAQVRDHFERDFGQFLHKPSRSTNGSGGGRIGGLIAITEPSILKMIYEFCGGEEAVETTNKKVISTYQKSQSRSRVSVTGNVDGSVSVNGKYKEETKSLTKEEYRNLNERENQKHSGANITIPVGTANNTDMGKPDGNREKASTQISDAEISELVTKLGAVTEVSKSKFQHVLEGFPKFVSEEIFQECVERLIKASFYAKGDNPNSPTGSFANSRRSTLAAAYKGYLCLCWQLGTCPRPEIVGLPDVKSDVVVDPEMAALLGLKF